MGSVFTWWFAVLVLGWAVFPIGFVLFRQLPDKGYFFSKVLGLLLLGYLSWLLGYVAFNGAVIFFAFSILVAISGSLLWSWTGKVFFETLQKKALSFIVTEGLFLLILLIAGAYKMRAHDIVGTEKPMDFAFINGILTSATMPPHDPWLSGGTISYYYFGYFIVAVLCKVTQVTPGEAFNLAIALTWALAAMGAFSLAYSLTGRFRYSFVSMGALAFFGNMDYWHRAFQSFAIGNLRHPYYNDPVGSDAVTGMNGFFGFLFSPLQHGWDYFQASRIMVVGTANDKMINEFPSFSFFLSDLHPHVMAIPFVLLTLALCLCLLKAPLPGLNVFGGRRMWQVLQWVIFALAFGGLSFMNSWDFPTFTLLLGLCLFLQQWWNNERDFVIWFKSVALVGIPIVVGAFALYIPFYLKFQSQAQGLGIAGSRTSLYYLWVLFGLFFVVLIPGLFGRSYPVKTEKGAKGKAKKTDSLICVVCGEEGSGKKFCGFCGGELALSNEEVAALPDDSLRQFLVKTLNWAGGSSDQVDWLTGGIWLVLFGVLWFTGFGTWAVALLFVYASLRFLAGHPESKEMVFTGLLVLVGFLLIGFCELFYMKDLFSSGDNTSTLHRMNTVFKFHYQVWILLSVAIGPFLKWIFDRQWSQWGPFKKGLWTALATFAFLGAFLYPVLAFASRMAGTSVDMATMDGAVYYEHTFPVEYQAAQWIKENVKPVNGKVPLILQVWGGSYHQEQDGIATLTGFPTILGWDFHEVQWRGSGDRAVIRGGDESDTINQREADINNIYSSADLNQTHDLLRKYGVDYVYVGDAERNKYNSSPNLGKFTQLGVPIWNAGNSVLYKINP